jgi:hypothetical protein
VEPSPVVGVVLPGLCGVCVENVGVVGRDLTEVPNATVGVVDRGVKADCRRLKFDEDDEGVGVLRPDMFEEELLRRLVLFKLPVDPKASELRPSVVLWLLGGLARFTIEEVIPRRLRLESLLPADELDEA